MGQALIITKTCSHCKTEKPLESFWASWSSRHADNRQSYCKSCCKKKGRAWADKNKLSLNERRRNEQTRQKASQRQFIKQLQKYDLAQEDYDTLVAMGCNICGSETSGQKRLHFDHDHTTGKFRGLLCGNCNTALGLMKDDLQRLQSAIQYLQENK